MGSENDHTASGGNVDFVGTLEEDSSKMDKIAMSSVAQLAKYNKLTQTYQLVNERGPAHEKTFTVRLTFSNGESYTGEGPSIKKAQKYAAKEALINTPLPRPDAIVREHSNRSTIPTLQSNSRSRSIPNSREQRRWRHQVKPPSMGLRPQGSKIRGNVMMTNPAKHLAELNRDLGFPPFNCVLVCNSRTTGTHSACCPMAPFMNKVFIGHGHSSLLLTPVSPMTSTTCNAVSGPPYHSVMCLQMDGNDFMGVGLDKESALENAALQALQWLSIGFAGTSFLGGKAYAPPEFTKEDVMTELSKKSAVSLLFEVGNRMDAQIQYQELGESGPPHSRHFLIGCQFIPRHSPVASEPIYAQGFGTSKRNAKHCASANLLLRLVELIPDLPLKAPELPPNVAKKPSGRKLIFKQMKAEPDYGEDINPVNRLIQVLQAQGAPEPSFAVLGSSGDGREKEFTVQVKVGEHICACTGPNKRISKRNAAEAMLRELGFLKALPEPTKSALKSGTTSKTPRAETSTGPLEEDSNRLFGTGPESFEQDQIQEQQEEQQQAACTNSLRKVKFSPDTRCGEERRKLSPSSSAAEVVEEGCAIKNLKDILTDLKISFGIDLWRKGSVLPTHLCSSNNVIELCRACTCHLVLELTPKRLCYTATGPSKFEAQEKAAVAALKDLAQKKLTNNHVIGVSLQDALENVLVLVCPKNEIGN